VNRTNIIKQTVTVIKIFGYKNRYKTLNEIERRNMPEPDYIAAHKHSFKSRKEIEQSVLCGCFKCLAIFSSSKIDDWWDEVDSIPQTPVCPKCGIDSVIGDKSGYPITKEFLKKMKKHFFW
jgi:hypothetical protein